MNKMKMMQRATIWTALAAWCLLLSWSTGLCSQGDSVLVIMPVERALSYPNLIEARGALLPGDELLVAVDQSAAALLEASGIPGGYVRPGELPLWITYAGIPDHLARELGLAIVLVTEKSTIFEASRDQAYHLLSRGYFVVPLDLWPLSNLWREPIGPRLTEQLLAQRPLTAARRRFIKAVSDSADSLRLKASISYLSFDPEAGEYKSRFQARPEVRQQIMPHLRDLLESYIAPYGGTVEEQDFKMKLGGPYAGGDSIFVNLVARKPGRKTSAQYVICAHYDAIGVHQPGWVENWRTWPAPGADDNGTGVAVVLECARLLGPVDIDVGITFITFSGEELGLLGSDYFATHLTEEDSIIGVINVDMVGYRDQTPSLEVVYDWKSEWLSDQLLETGDIIGLETYLEPLNLSGVRDSDHGSFWKVGIPGTMIIEEFEGEQGTGGGPLNPYYHSLGDTLGNLDMTLVWESARLVTGFMLRLAETPEDTLVDISVSSGSIEFDWDGRDTGDPLVAGSPVSGTIRALNVGASMDEARPYSLELWQGNKGSGTSIHQSQESLQLLSGQHTDILISWESDPQQYGLVPFTIALMPLEDGLEGNLANNLAQASLEIMAQTVVLENLHVFPNPVDDPSRASISFNIYHPDGDFDGLMRVWIYDILGNRIGEGSLERSPAARELVVGCNTVGLARFLKSGQDLAPGLYFCRASLRLLRTAGVFDASFSFAVDR